MTDDSAPRDHGGGLDAAILRYGGTRGGWIDLSTGINPRPYSTSQVPGEAWTALPDANAMDMIVAAARSFWSVPDGAGVLAAPGASALIAQIPRLVAPGTVVIPRPTYNEHAAAFAQSGWTLADKGDARVIVHPNNPDGRIWHDGDLGPATLTVIDESFCDVMPERSLIHMATRRDVVILKSFGKFWGLAGLRLGFAIARHDTLDRLAAMMGPWPVSGPALSIGARALKDRKWANATRERLAQDAARLDALMTGKGAAVAGGTDLFRLYAVDDAVRWQDRLAQAHIWTRVFPYSQTWLRLGLPGQHSEWARLERALR